jgi:phage terminase large subunit-like protein
MKKDNYIYAYYQKIKDGTIVVGKWIMLLMEYIVNGLEKKEFFYDKKKANHAVEWIEEHGFHTEGDLAPGYLKLELWQKCFISCLFGIVDKDGLRQFREVVLVVGRKNGKSLLAAAIAKYVWWVDGGFGAKVYNIAPKLDQADIIYNNIWQMVILDPEYQQMKEELSERDAHNKKIKDDSMLPKLRQSDLYIQGTNSQVKKVAFAVKSSDGFNPSLCICDEVAAWKGADGLKQYEVFKSGMGARREPILLSCTTSGYVEGSIYDEIMKRASRFLLGESKEKKLLPFLYMIDDVEKWNDIQELQKSLPNLGVSVSVDFMLEEIAIAEGSLSKKAEFMCKYCNIKQNSSLAWLPASVVQNMCGDPLDLEDFRGCYCVVGLDLSQTTDLTSACFLIQKEGHIYVFSKFWLPNEKIDEAIQRDSLPYNLYIQRGLLETSGDNFIDYHDCFNWIISVVKKYKLYVQIIGYDRYSAQYLVQELNGCGLKTDDVYQGDNLWGVLQEMEGLFKDGKVHIGDNDLLKVHLLNSAVKMSVERGRGKLVKLNASSHIDGVAAMADAFCVRQKWWGEIGRRLENNKKKE